jgi:hypothetical protein
MYIEKDSIKKLVNEFTSQTIGLENPEGLCFLTCFPISILLEIHQIHNSISCGDAPKNNSFVNHCWITLDNEETIIDPTIRQFDSNMESTYIGKLEENKVTKKYIPINAHYQEWFVTAYNNWAEPLIGKQPRTYREPGFENKMNLINIKTAIVLYSYISKMETKNQIMSSFKCYRYFSPIFKFIKDKSETDSKFILNLKDEMPKNFDLLLSIALSK